MDNHRPETMQRITTPELAQAFIDEQIAALQAQIGDKKVILGLSGGVDSSVAAALLSRAVGKQLTCVFVDHGLMRKDLRIWRRRPARTLHSSCGSRRNDVDGPHRA